MPLFKVYQYERHESLYEIEAEDRNRAVLRVMAKTCPPALATTYVELDEKSGISSDDDPELVDFLSAEGFRIRDHIPSIASVEEVTEED